MLLGRISSASKNSFSNWNLIRQKEHKRTLEIDFIECRASCCGSQLLRHIFPSVRQADLASRFFASWSQAQRSSYTPCIVSEDCIWKDLACMLHTSLLGWISCPWPHTSIFAPHGRTFTSIMVKLQRGAKRNPQVSLTSSWLGAARPDITSFCSSDRCFTSGTQIKTPDLQA